MQRFIKISALAITIVLAAQIALEIARTGAKPIDALITALPGFALYILPIAAWVLERFGGKGPKQAD